MHSVLARAASCGTGNDGMHGGLRNDEGTANR